MPNRPVPRPAAELARTIALGALASVELAAAAIAAIAAVQVLGAWPTAAVVLATATAILWSARR